MISDDHEIKSIKDGESTLNSDFKALIQDQQFIFK